MSALDPVVTATVTSGPPENHKLLLVVLALACATMLVLIPSPAPHLTGAEWVSCVTWVIGTYMLGQAAGVVADGFVNASAVKAVAAENAKAAAVAARSTSASS